MFTVQYVKNLQWENAEHTLFSCLVKYEEFDEEHPTGVNATDQYEHIRNIWANALDGRYGEIAEYVPPPEPTPAPDSEQPATQGTQTL